MDRAPTDSENMNDLAKKKADISERLQKRDEERLAEMQRRKEEKENVTAENESTTFFVKNFSRTRWEIEQVLADSDSVEKNKRLDHFDCLVLSLQKLQKFTSDTAVFLPSYEVQKAQETINKLQRDIQGKRDELIPKKKFAFRSKKKVVESFAGDTKPKAEATKKEIKVDITGSSFADLSGEVLIKRPDEVTDKDVTLARLSDCTVKIFGSPSAVHIDRLTNCKVLTGPVAGSVFIDHSTNCTFVVGCQQLRVHHSTASHFYIHVTSRAIIEDCNTLKFAPYTWSYDGIEEHYEVSRLDKSRNSWDDVDDFNWLANDCHSPNWDILEESNRITSWHV